MIASDVQMEKLDDCKSDPARDGSEEREIQNAEPDGGESVVKTDGAIEVTMREESGGDERDGEEEDSSSKCRGRDGVVAGNEEGECYVHENVEDQEEQLDDGDETGHAEEAERRSLGIGYPRIGCGHTVF